MVRDGRLELPAWWSQTTRATNCANPGYWLFPFFESFPVCGHLCGQSRFLARFADPVKSRKCPCCKGFRDLAVPIVDRTAYAPKAGALPTALHPVICFCGAGRILRDRRDRGVPDHYNPSATAAQAFINFLLTLKIPAIWAEFVRHYWWGGKRPGRNTKTWLFPKYLPAKD